MSRSVAKFKLTPKQQKLVEDNLNLARREAWRYHRRTEIDYKVLESVAFEGLCQAAHRYDDTLLNERTGKPMRFSSIAVPYARGAILHYMRDKTYLLRLSHKMREQWIKGRRLIFQGYSDKDIAKYLDISLQDWLETRVTCSGPPLELKEAGAPTIDDPMEELDLANVYIKASLDFYNSQPKALQELLTTAILRHQHKASEKLVLDTLGEFLKIQLDNPLEK